MRNLLASFIFQEECRMKIEHVLFPSVFPNLPIRVSDGHFYCVHTIRFSEPTKVGSLKSDRMNEPQILQSEFLKSRLLVDIDCLPPR